MELPGWQAIYQQLKDKNFEIISVAEDTGGVKDAGKAITDANPSYTVLIDQDISWFDIAMHDAVPMRVLHSAR